MVWKGKRVEVEKRNDKESIDEIGEKQKSNA